MEERENTAIKHPQLLPVCWLLVIGADGCLVIMADTYLVRRAAHLQTGVLGGVWT